MSDYKRRVSYIPPSFASPTQRFAAHKSHARSKTRHTNGIKHQSNETHDWAVLLPLALPPDLPPVMLILLGAKVESGCYVMLC